MEHIYLAIYQVKVYGFVVKEAMDPSTKIDLCDPTVKFDNIEITESCFILRVKSTCKGVIFYQKFF